MACEIRKNALTDAVDPKGMVSIGKSTRASFVPHNVVHGSFVPHFSGSWRNVFLQKFTVFHGYLGPKKVSMDPSCCLRIANFAIVS